MMAKTEMTTPAENHSGAAKTAGERAARNLKIALLCIIVVMGFGWEIALEYFSPVAGAVLSLGIVAVLCAAAAVINIALKKRMTADGYATWQIEALKIAEFVLFLAFLLLALGVTELPATFVPYGAIFFPVLLGVYIAAGMKIHGALKKRMTADAYAAWMTQAAGFDIFACCLGGLLAFAGALAFMPALLVFVLPISAAVIAAMMIFRALLKKHLTAAAYSTLPPVFCVTLIMILCVSLSVSVFAGKAGI